MTPSAYIYDPSIADPQSAVRGIGRYMKLLRDSFSTQIVQALSESSTPLPSPVCSFVSKLTDVPANSIFINPFISPVAKPLQVGRIARKQIGVIHDVIPLKYPSHFPVGWRGWWYTFLTKWSLKNYDLLVTDSEQSKRDIVHFLKIPPAKIVVIYPSVEPTYLPHLDNHPESVEHHHPFHLNQGKEEAEFSAIQDRSLIANERLRDIRDYVIYVGDGTWNKNLLNIALAVKIANVRCVCVGKIFVSEETKVLSQKPNPWLASFYRFLKETQDNPLFIFPGFVSDLELLALYRNARLNMLPSFDEGFGLSYLEAGYLSVPSVLADIPVFHEIAGKSALYTNPNDPKDIAQKIATLFYDNSVHEKLSIEVFDRAQQFRPESFKVQWTEVIRKMQG